MRVYRRVGRHTAVSVGPFGCLVYAVVILATCAAILYYPFWLLATAIRLIFG